MREVEKRSFNPDEARERLEAYLQNKFPSKPYTSAIIDLMVGVLSHKLRRPITNVDDIAFELGVSNREDGRRSVRNALRVLRNSGIGRAYK